MDEYLRQVALERTSRSTKTLDPRLRGNDRMSARCFWSRIASPVCGVACAWLLTATPADAQSAAVRSMLEHLRGPNGACAAKAPPMTPRDALDAAARRIAQGAELGDALRATGYRVAQAQVLTLSGPDLRANLERQLAHSFCAQIANAQWTDLGVHLARDQVWIVLAQVCQVSADF